MWCRSGNDSRVPSSKPVEDAERRDNETYHGVHHKEPPVEAKTSAVRLGLLKRCRKTPSEGEKVWEEEHCKGDLRERDHDGEGEYGGFTQRVVLPDGEDVTVVRAQHRGEGR